MVFWNIDMKWNRDILKDSIARTVFCVFSDNKPFQDA